MEGLPQDENKELLHKIKEGIEGLTPHVASVSSKMCPNVKGAFQLLCSQLMEHSCVSF